LANDHHSELMKMFLQELDCPHPSKLAYNHHSGMMPMLSCKFRLVDIVTNDHHSELMQMFLQELDYPIPRSWPTTIILE